MSFHNVALYLDQRFGKSAWAELVSGLSVADQHVVSSMLPIGWYELDRYMRMLVRMQALHGAREPHLLDDYGRFCASHDLTTTHDPVLEIRLSCSSPDGLTSRYFYRLADDDNDRPREVYFQQNERTGLSRVDFYMSYAASGEHYAFRFHSDDSGLVVSSASGTSGRRSRLGTPPASLRRTSQQRASR